LRGSSGKDAIQILEGKLEANTAQGRPRRMWLDDIKEWTQLKKLKIWLKIDTFFGELALLHVNLLFQKTTADDDDDDLIVLGGEGTQSLYV